MYIYLYVNKMYPKTIGLQYFATVEWQNYTLCSI